MNLEWQFQRRQHVIDKIAKRSPEQAAAAQARLDELKAQHAAKVKKK